MADDYSGVATPANPYAGVATPQPNYTKVASPGFWERFGHEFGKASGGWAGITTAWESESIPAELWKAARREVPAELDPFGATGIAMASYHAMEKFLSKDDKRPIHEQLQDAFSGLVKTAKEHPGAMAGSLVKGFAADPELFFLPGLGEVGVAAKAETVARTAGLSARGAEVAGTVAGKGAAVSGAAGIGGAQEAAHELGEGTALDPGAIGVSALMTAPLGLVQFHRTPKEAAFSNEEVQRIMGPAVREGREAPAAEVVPTADGYLVRLEGRPDEAKTFATKAEAESAARELDGISSAYRALGADPQIGLGKMKRLLAENPYEMSFVQKMIQYPKDIKLSAGDLAKFLGKMAVSAGIGAGIGAALDKDDRALAMAFGAGVTILPRMASLLSPATRRLSVSNLINLRNGLQAVWLRHTLIYKGAIDRAVPEPLRRQAISHALEGEIPEKLNPAEQQVADSMRDFFDSVRDAAVNAGILRDVLENYVTHIVEGADVPPASLKEALGRILDAFMARGGGGEAISGRRFAKHRAYGDLVDLGNALKGSNLQIKTTDIGEIMTIYSKAMFKAITDKRLVDALKQSPIQAPDMPPSVQGAEILNPDHYPRTEVPPGPGDPPEPTEPPGATAQKFAARERYIIQPINERDPNYTSLTGRAMAGYVAHRDVAPQLEFILGGRDPSFATRFLSGLSQLNKRMIVSWSLFHAKSLFDAFVGAMGTKAIGNPKRMAERAIEKYFSGGEHSDAYDELLLRGLVLNTPEDAATDVLHSSLSRIAKIVDAYLPVSAAGAAAKKIAEFNGIMDHFTFGTLQTGFKLITAFDSYQRLLEKGLSQEASARMASSYTNDIYGSLDWMRIGDEVGSTIGRDLIYGFFSPQGRRWTQILLFAPDWTFSTFRAAYKALPGAVDDAALGALHRRYLVKSAIYYLTFANALNYLYSGHPVWKNKNPTRIELRDKRTQQFSKHAMEPFEWARDPAQTALNKMSFVPRETFEFLMGKEYLSAHGNAPDIIGNRALHFVKQFAPIYAQQGLQGGGAESVAGLFGLPIYGKTPEQQRAFQKEQAKARQEKRKRAAEYRRS